jgi:hypothetical protein
VAGVRPSRSRGGMRSSCARGAPGTVTLAKWTVGPGDK